MIRNAKDSWGWPARALHWMVALLAIMTFALGLWMGEVPSRADRPYYIAIHASLGITLLIILTARLVWALANTTPAPPSGTPVWQVRAARITHISLYAVTFIVVLFGWLLVGSMHPPIVPQAFGFLPVPAPLDVGAYDDFFEEAHELVAYALIALASVHALAALWHHYVMHDDTLRRMLGGNAPNAPRA